MILGEISFIWNRYNNLVSKRTINFHFHLKNLVINQSVLVQLMVSNIAKQKFFASGKPEKIKKPGGGRAFDGNRMLW